MKQCVLDVECYRNFFYVLFMDMASGKAKGFSNYADEGLDVVALQKLLTHPDIELVTFNGNSYDIPMISLALSGASTSELKDASDHIISNNLRPWAFYKRYNLSAPTDVNHIDLIEVAPSMCSLKLYGGRLHTQKMQDLPIDPDAKLTLKGSKKIETYCRNDLEMTRDLVRAVTPQIDLRRTMSATYGTDLRSKSDSQIAEAVLIAEYKRITGEKPAKTTIDYTRFKYTAPTYVKFRTDQLQEALRVIEHADFVIKDTGHVQMPKAVEQLRIVLGSTTYKLGIGGLHSQESEQMLSSDGDTTVIDRDVVSYYPNLMLNMGMAPPSFGTHFQAVYRNILEERVAAKKAGDMVTSNTLKIVLNGTFGKTSNKYSYLYSPIMMIHTTLTGQLSLLMLIEALEGYGVPVRSANTDGIVMEVAPDKYAGYLIIVSRWEKHCALETEETRYDALYSRDVNSYIAITEDGKVKTKGAYGDTGLMKNPQNAICAEAVVNYLKNNIPVEDTIRYSDDIRKFITVRTVNGGAVKEGYPLVLQHQLPRRGDILQDQRQHGTAINGCPTRHGLTRSTA